MQFDEWEGPEDEIDAELAAWGDHSKECPHKINDPDKYDSSGDKKTSHGHSHSDKDYYEDKVRPMSEDVWQLFNLGLFLQLYPP